MDRGEALFEYVLRLGDNALVLGHRLSEWVGHAPALEEEMATANVALDLIGQARSWLAYAGEVEGRGRDEDALAYHRDVLDFHNALLVELPNGHYGDTITRQLFFDAFHYHQLEALSRSADDRIAEIAAKSLKEVGYHLRRSGEWLVRLGDGTEESHERVQQSVDDLWMYTGELFAMDDVDRLLLAEGVGADLEAIHGRWDEHVSAVLREATLTRPEDGWMQSGGKQGSHSEHLGYILAEMQFLPRAHPDARW
ncbi:phenylacetate-CoA oxygenase subunit PaaC [Ectothiorhodospiraceae bacterium WFHF3C12]|nr:phenylacetate-CoA oxygenase subunit PaaC [Ectothiorhodospiraceae bacterium WFHF3C12]